MFVLAQNGLANWEWAHCERGDDTLFHKSSIVLQAAFIMRFYENKKVP